MRSLPIGWNAILAKLGFKRKLQKGLHRRTPFSRRLSLEPLEDRRVLAVLTVNTDVDAVSFNDETLTLREAMTIVQAGTTAGFVLSEDEKDQIDPSAGFNNNQVEFDFDLNEKTIKLDPTLGQIAYASSGKILTIDASNITSLTIDAETSTLYLIAQPRRLMIQSSPYFSSIERVS